MQRLDTLPSVGTVAAPAKGESLRVGVVSIATDFIFEK